jgi:hypothetical protein
MASAVEGIRGNQWRHAVLRAISKPTVFSNACGFWESLKLREMLEELT